MSHIEVGENVPDHPARTSAIASLTCTMGSIGMVDIQIGSNMHVLRQGDTDMGSRRRTVPRACV